MEEELLQKLFKMDDNVNNYGVQSKYCGELEDIAHDIICLGLDGNEPLPRTLKEFTEYWEFFGSDSGNFDMLYECCVDTLSRRIQPTWE